MAAGALVRRPVTEVMPAHLECPPLPSEECGSRQPWLITAAESGDGQTCVLSPDSRLTQRGAPAFCGLGLGSCFLGTPELLESFDGPGSRTICREAVPSSRTLSEWRRSLESRRAGI